MSINHQILQACLKLEADGLNRGASGNVSVRDGDDMIITPSGIAYDVLEPSMMVRMPLASDNGAYEGDYKPSSEWRFHRDILRARPDVNAVVHTHARYSTIVSCARKPIPAIHYMIAAFGGPEVRVSDYARYGTDELSKNIIAAMEGRNGCLMANHGMVVAGADLTRAMWLAGELEALADQYYHLLALGPVEHILTDAQIAETAKGFESYGVQAQKDA